jgi:hypothetical protein
MDKLARKIVQRLQWGTKSLKPSVARQLRSMREAALRRRPNGGLRATSGLDLDQRLSMHTGWAKTIHDSDRVIAKTLPPMAP